MTSDAKKMTLGIVGFILLIFGMWIGYSFGMRGLRTEETKPPIDTSSWQTYRNDVYGFEIRYPSNWQVAAFPDNAIAPRFNIHKNSETALPPFDHHSSVTQVSIFPHGVPTEGVFGEERPTTVLTPSAVSEGTDFVLKDGTPWGTFLYIKNAPASWNESGFVWAELMIEGLIETCVDEAGKVVAGDTCDTLGTGNTIARSGTVSADDRAIEEAILASLTLFEVSGEEDDMVRVDTPQEDDVVSSPLTVTGVARGFWYFEASFPIELLDGNGNTLALVPAQAQSDWMTEDFVPFSVTLEFERPETSTGTLVLHKDNPSGLPENEDERRIPVRFE